MEKTAVNRRPIIGGTNSGKRPKRYDYWRTGYGERTNPKLDFWVAQAGEYHCSSPFESGAFEHHGRLQFYYQTAGRSTVIADRFAQQIEPDCLLIIPPFQTFSLFSNEPVKFHWLGLEGVLPKVLDFGLTVAPNFHNERQLIDRFIAIRELLISQPIGYAFKGIGLVYELLSLLETSIDDVGSNSQYPEIVRKALYFLDENCHSSFNSDRLAEHLGISHSYCRQMFRQYVGESPKKVHMRFRMTAAERLLMTQDLSVREVATHLGFNDPYHFSKAFKKMKGVSPNSIKQRGRPKNQS